MRCVCSDVESARHVWLDCNLYVDVRRRWKEKINTEHADIYEAIQGYEVNNECIENETMCYLGMMWSSRQRSELRNLMYIWCDCKYEQSKVLYEPIKHIKFHSH